MSPADITLEKTLPNSIDSERAVLGAILLDEKAILERVKPHLVILSFIKPGRSFSAEEFQPGHDQVLLISQRLWQRRRGGDPNIVGRAVTLQQKS